jgi:hypothetical protein
VPTQGRGADEITATAQPGEDAPIIISNSPQDIQPGSRDENQSQANPDRSQDSQIPDSPHGEESPDHDRSHDQEQSAPSRDNGSDQQRETPDDK